MKLIIFLIALLIISMQEFTKGARLIISSPILNLSLGILSVVTTNLIFIMCKFGDSITANKNHSALANLLRNQIIRGVFIIVLWILAVGIFVSAWTTPSGRYGMQPQFILAVVITFIAYAFLITKNSKRIK